MILNDIQLSRIQEIEYEILIQLDKFCKKYDIKYILFGGTMLGAIRHKGFIPWDDDIDIAMLRKDYEKFIKLYSKNIPSHLFLQNALTDKEYPLLFTKIRLNNTVFLESDLANFNIHHGVYIDLFPLDVINVNSITGKIHLFTVKILINLNRLRLTNILKRKKSPFNFFLVTLSYFIKFIPPKHYSNFTNWFMGVLNNSNNQTIAHLSNGASKKRVKKYLMFKSDFCDCIETYFVGTMFKVPRRYDDILTNCYGDYMELPSIESRVAHHELDQVVL
jgi:lipopolysaccharide cholinephosphotransferase